ncbi:MAG: hypothetical protein R3244_09540, partial [Thermoanaerobaculia bacterium]|nr:hypothetical protein [Thermoanaerobaculia bacterium]
LLAGVDEKGTPIDGQMIRFPTQARFEFEDRKTPPEIVELGGASVSATGYVRALPSIASLAVLDEDGQTIATAALPSTDASLRDRRLPVQFGLSAPALAQPIVNTSACSHVEILTADDWSLLEYVPQGLESLVTPQPRQLAGLLAGLGRMTPLLCQSVSTIAFGDFGSGTLGMVHIYVLGDAMMVNSRVYTEAVLTPGNANEPFRRMDLQQTVVHEAGHAAEALLNSLGLSIYTVISRGEWPLNARAMADDTIEAVRLKSGFGSEWARVHDSFVDLGWATDYVDIDDAWNLSAAQVAHSGFMSPYGASGHFEDVAETIGWTYIGHEYPAAGVTNRRRDRGCTEMSQHTDKSVPSDLAAIYTKVHFLLDLGLVHPEDVEKCTGTNIGIPVTTEGFEIWQGGTKKRNFDSEVAAGIGTRAITPSKVFTMKAGGTAAFGGASYPATLELQLDLGSVLPIDYVPWPRGAYQFGSSWGGNNLRLRVDGASAGNWDADAGFALVTEASNDRIVGSIFLTRALRVSVPSPLPAYDSFDPPLIIRFLMEK